VRKTRVRALKAAGTKREVRVFRGKETVTVTRPTGRIWRAIKRGWVRKTRPQLSNSRATVVSGKDLDRALAIAWAMERHR
jgi:hypothetical protein